MRKSYSLFIALFIITHSLNAITGWDSSGSSDSKSMRYSPPDDSRSDTMYDSSYSGLMPAHADTNTSSSSNTYSADYSSSSSHFNCLDTGNSSPSYYYQCTETVEWRSYPEVSNNNSSQSSNSTSDINYTDSYKMSGDLRDPLVFEYNSRHEYPSTPVMLTQADKGLDPDDERTSIYGSPTGNLTVYRNMIPQLFYGHGNFPTITNRAAQTFPHLKELYKASKTFDEFKKIIYEEAEKIRQNPNYLRNYKDNEYGIKRYYWLFCGLIGSSKDYSVAQQIIFSIEQDLIALERQEALEKLDRESKEIAELIEWPELRKQLYLEAFIDALETYNAYNDFYTIEENQNSLEESQNNQPPCHKPIVSIPKKITPIATTLPDIYLLENSTPISENLSHNRTNKPDNDNDYEDLDDWSSNQNNDAIHEPSNTFHNQEYLKSLADTYAAQSLLLTNNQYEKNIATFLQERAAALHRGAQQPTLLRYHGYQFDSVVPNDFAEQLAKLPTMCNHAQARLYSEIYNSLAALKKLANNDGYITHSITTIVHMGTSALVQEDPDIAFNLSETTHHLTNITLIIANTISSIGSTITHGAIKAGYTYIATITDLAHHPIDTLLNEIKAPIKLASQAFGAACITLFGNTEERTELWNIMVAIKDHVYENPEDVIALGIMLFLPGPKNIILNTSNKVAKISKLSTLNHIIEHSPIACTAAAGLQPIQKVIKNGVGTAVAQYASLCDEVYARFKKLPLTKKSYKHIFDGEIVGIGKNKIPSGLHVEKSCTKLIPNLTLPADKHGVYVAYYQRGNWAKFSTFFPKYLSNKEIIKLMHEAYQNPISKSAGEIIGKTHSGMLIRIVFTIKKGIIFVKTAHPLYKGLNNAKQLMKQMGKTEMSFEIV